MTTLQNVTVAGLVADLGITGYKGITTSVNGDDSTKLDVTIASGAWALLGNGTLLTTELVAVTVQAPTDDGDYHLYIDESAGVTAPVLAWTIGESAPSASALDVADVTVADGIISASTSHMSGLRNFPVSAFYAGHGVPSPSLGHEGDHYLDIDSGTVYELGAP